jgi:hypothetical protein
VFDFFSLAQLAGPASVKQLASRVLRFTLCIREQGDFLDIRFDILAVAGQVAKCSEGLLKGGKGSFAGNPGRPVLPFYVRARPPLFPGLSRGPRDAIVIGVCLAGDPVISMYQAGEKLF